MSEHLSSHSRGATIPATGGNLPVSSATFTVFINPRRPIQLTVCEHCGVVVWDAAAHFAHAHPERAADDEGWRE